MREVKCEIMMGFPYTRRAYQAPRHVWSYFALVGQHLGSLYGSHVLVTDDL